MQLPVMPKYGFSAVIAGDAVSFASFDAEETAQKIRDDLAGHGIECSQVVPVHTATTARQVLAAVKKGWQPRLVVQAEPYRQVQEPGRLVRRDETMELPPAPARELEAPRRERVGSRLRRWWES